MEVLLLKPLRKLQYQLILICLIVSGYFANAQQSVSIGTTTIKSNAVLYLVSQGKNQGLIIPVVSGKANVSTPDAGMLVYDESDNKLYYRDNSTWVPVSASGGVITLGGDLSGTPATANVAKLQGKILSAAAPNNGDILKYNSTTSSWELSTDISGSVYTAGTGISIVSNQIGIANDGVTTTQIAPNTITNTDLNKTTIPLSGFGAAAASVDIGNQKIINLATPTATTDATTKAYVDGAVATKLSSTVLTTAGDILYHDGVNVTRLPRGTNGQLLQSTAGSIQWTTSSALINPMNAQGDIIFGGAGGTPTKLPGTAGFLKSTGAFAPAWSAVNVAGTDITGTLPLLNGGTGATTAAAARTNLGLGTLATLNVVGSAEITDNQIVNADVATGAAIDGVKISPDFGTQNVVTTGNVGIGTNAPATKLHVLNSAASISPALDIQATDPAGDASANLASTTDTYTIGTTSAGSFKISNSIALGTNDNLEIRTGTTDASGVSKVFMDMGPRGQDGLHVSSTSAWGTSIHLSNGGSTSTTAGYTMAVTGAGGPTGQAGDFAMLNGTSKVMTIGYNSAGPNYAVTFPQYSALFSTYEMRMGINLGTSTTPSYNLEINGNAAKSVGGSTWTVTSDLRLKKDISKYTDGLNVITKINPIWFRYNGKGGSKIGDLQVGVAAQEMKEIAPYTVGRFNAKYDENATQETEFYNFDYSAIGYALINAVKELDTKVKALESENALLKQQLKDSITKRPTEESSSLLKAELEKQKTRTDQLESQLTEIKRLLSIEANSKEK